MEDKRFKLVSSPWLDLELDFLATGVFCFEFLDIFSISLVYSQLLEKLKDINFSFTEETFKYLYCLYPSPIIKPMFLKNRLLKNIKNFRYEEYNKDKLKLYGSNLSFNHILSIYIKDREEFIKVIEILIDILNKNNFKAIIKNKENDRIKLGSLTLRVKNRLKKYLVKIRTENIITI